MITYKQVWKVIDFYNETSDIEEYKIDKNKLNVEVYKAEKEFKHIDETTQSYLKDTGATLQIDKEEKSYSILLFPKKIKANSVREDIQDKYLLVACVQLLLHEMRHYLQNVYLEDYTTEFQREYIAHVQAGDRDDHWSEKDADAFSINFIVDNYEGLASLLKVSTERMNIMNRLEHEVYDLEDLRNYYRGIKESR